MFASEVSHRASIGVSKQILNLMIGLFLPTADVNKIKERSASTESLRKGVDVGVCIHMAMPKTCEP